MGAVPVQEPKWFLSGNRVMSPTSTSSRAAPEGPIRSGPSGWCRWRRPGRSVPCSRPSCAGRSARGRRSVRRRPGAGSCRRRRAGGRWRAASWPGRRTGPSSPRRGSARAAGGGPATSCGCAPRPAIVAGRPGSAAPPGARRRPQVAGRSSGCRPAPPSARRWRRSCGPARWRTPAPARTASVGRRRPARLRPAAGWPRADRCPGIPRSPRPGPATPERTGASRHDRHGRLRTDLSRRLIRPRHDLDRDRAFVRVHPDDHSRWCLSMVSSELEPDVVVELGGQRYFELGQTPLEPLPPWRRPGMRRPNESHTEVGSRNESDNPGRLDRASSGTGPCRQ